MMTSTNDEGSSNKGTIEWEIASLDALEHLEFKQNQTIGGFHWDVEAVPEEKNLVFSMYSVGDRNCFHICKTSIKLEEEGTDTVAVINDFGEQMWIDFSKWTLSTEIAKIATGTFPKALRMQIAVTWAPCQTILPSVDAILEVEPQLLDANDTIPVNRHVLAGHSAYFRKLFFGPWGADEEQQPQTTTGIDGKLHYKFNVFPRCDFDPDYFAMMLCGVQLLGINVCELNCLQAMHADERVHRYLQIHNMAVKYELPMWSKYAQKMLLIAGPGTMRVLELAESLNLPALKEHCLKTLDPLDYAKFFDWNTQIYNGLCEQTQKRVADCLQSNAWKQCMEAMHSPGRGGCQRTEKMMKWHKKEETE